MEMLASQQQVFGLFAMANVSTHSTIQKKKTSKTALK